MKTLRCCSIVMHIHDELVIEADPRMSLDVLCEQMGRTPPWAKGLKLRADGYVTPFYKKIKNRPLKSGVHLQWKLEVDAFKSARKGGLLSEQRLSQQRRLS